MIRAVTAASGAVFALCLLVHCSHKDEQQGAGPPDAAGDDGGADVDDAGAPGDAVADVRDAMSCPDASQQSELECTGLYTDIVAKSVAPGIVPYAPAYPLWSDGAVESRWIRLPAGTQIDTSDMDEWRFPIGTTFWKEFVVDGRRVETRMIRKEPDGSWLRQTFEWSSDETRATELVGGKRNVNGGTYEIPQQDACRVCHSGRIDGVLGFEAVSLAGPGATGLTLDELVARGLVTKPPTAPITLPGSATERAGIAWLHANCGTACHNASPDSTANFTYMYLRLNVAQLGAVASTDTVKTTVNATSGYQPNDGGALLRIAPGDPAHSVVVIRASVRDPDQKIQMPPILTHQVDDAGVAAVSDWIRSMQ